MGRLATRRNVLLFSLLLALITSSLIYKFLRTHSGEKTVITIPVVVSTSEIGARKVIKPNEVCVQYKPSSAVDGEVCSSLEEVVGKATMVKIPKGTVITPASVGEPSIKLGLSYAVPPYMRAVTVAIDDVSGVAGFLKPGDHVDIIGAFESNQRSTARTILQDVELLALGPEVEQEKVTKNTGKARANQKTTATLLVAPEDAERLVLADTQGKLRLVLRAQGDVLRVVTGGAEGPKVTGIPEGREAVVQAASQTSESKPASAEPQTKPTAAAAQARPLTSPRPLMRDPLPPGRLTQVKSDANPTTEIQVIRGSKIESVEVEDTEKALTSKTKREVEGANLSSG